MFNKMKLGTKITLGFGVLILIAGIFGIISVWNMVVVDKESTKLAEEYLPELRVATDLRGAANRLMFSMRSYGLTEEERYYQLSLKELDNIKNALKEGEELEARAKNLKMLKSQLNEANLAYVKYRDLIEVTKGILNEINNVRETLDESAAQYMLYCNSYLDGQNAKIKRDLKARQDKISLVSSLVDIGSSARVHNFKAQATNSSKTMALSIKEMSGVNSVLEKLQALSKDREDIERINSIKRASLNYTKAMEDFIRERRRGERGSVLKRIRDEMDKNAGIYVKNCKEFLDGQQEKLKIDMESRVEKINLSSKIVDLCNDTRIKNFKAQALREPEFIKMGLENFSQMEKIIDDLKSRSTKSADLERLDLIKKSALMYKDAMISFLANWDKLNELSEEREKAGDRLIRACKTITKAGLANTEKIANSAVKMLTAASNFMVVGLIIAAIIGVTFAVFITRSITKPINRVIAGLNDGAEQVASAAGEVSTASQTLAEGASEQAASIEETSSSLEEMASQTKQNADNAVEADSLMKEARNTVNDANSSMENLSQSMVEINSAGEETSKIIKTIDEIAFQTNLLALNAAVEAARAGEAGAGFAVVADEVRNLAMRASEAAKNTSELIEGIVKKIKEGSEMTELTSSTFIKVSESASRVAELVSEISAASDEQSKGIEQINLAVSQMDKVTQTNAANAEESASASEQLNAQAEQMKSMVGDLAVMVRGETGRTSTYSGELSHENLMSVMSAPGKAVQKPRSVTRDTGMKGREVSPDKIIPFDDDEDDFEEWK